MGHARTSSPMHNSGHRRKNYSLSLGRPPYRGTGQALRNIGWRRKNSSLSLGGCLIIALTEVYCRAEKLSEVLR